MTARHSGPEGGSTGFTAAPGVSTAAIDYLQRVDVPSGETLSGPHTAAPLNLRRLQRIAAIGVPRKPNPDEMPATEPELPIAGALTGLAGYGIPFAFALVGHATEVAVHVGTWSPGGRAEVADDVLDARQEILRRLIGAAYPSVEFSPPHADLPADQVGGVGIGLPTSTAPARLDGTLPIDRLIRAMSGSRWMVLVLAEPVTPVVVTDLRHRVVNEMRAVEAAAQSTRAPSPLAEHYLGLLEANLGRLTVAHSVGAWRTALYLVGDPGSYHQLATAWRATYTGADSLAEPLRVVPHPAVPALAHDWALPDASAPPGPGHVHHPFAWQTMLDSATLAAYTHCPRLETSGFAVRLEPHFDSVPPATNGATALRIGEVVGAGRAMGTGYTISRDGLNRHGLVAGLTGSGKTNTIRHLLHELAGAGTPFLVIEPAKREYRGLLGAAGMADLRVLTPGDERQSPLRLNPFEVPEGTPVGEHLDLLRAVFAASFGMWTPLPQVLDRCLVEVYTDQGWDLTSDRNARLDDPAQRNATFPILGDLLAKIRHVTPQLGYEQRVTDNIDAALTTRLASLQRGGRGRLFDTRRSFPITTLLDAPTVIELEGMTDDDDKAFFMALLLVRLVEHRRYQGPASGLKHLLVVEEAHRLLAASAAGRTATEQADPRGKAVESFTHLLSEVRAYGQGVLLADQVPGRLAPDAVKNTSLKIAHRIVAADDQQALAAAMGMDRDQAAALTALPVGRAAVFSDGDDAPVLVQVPLGPDTGRIPDDATLAGAMADWRHEHGLEELLSPLASCKVTCADERAACDWARVGIGEPAVQRVVARTLLSVVEDATALARLWTDMVDVVRAGRPPGITEQALLRALAGHAADWYATRRGAQAGWSYTATAELAASGCRMLVAKCDEADTAEPIAEFQARSRGLAARDHAPYAACDKICQHESPQCLYRHAAADLVASGRHRTRWQRAEAEDVESSGTGRRQTWEVAMDAGYELVQFPEPDAAADDRDLVAAAARRASLCFAQQMLADDESKLPRSIRMSTVRLLEAAGI